MRCAARVFAFALRACVLAAAAPCLAGYFDVDGSMEANGWKLVRSEPRDVFSVSGGELSMKCACNPYKGTLYSRPVELPENGEMSFEIRVGEGIGPMNRMAILFKLGGLQLSVMGNDMMRHWAVDGSEWKCVGEHRVATAQWTRVKVVWDNAAGRIWYYVGDMRIPSASEAGRIGPEPGESGMTVKIGNYGLDRNVFTHRMRGLSIGEAKRERSDGAGERRLAIVFHGLGSEFFPVEKWLAGFPMEDRVDFFLAFRGSQYLPENKMMLDGYPDAGLVGRAKLIVIADMPLSGEVMPYEVQEDILAAVSGGARLIVTGGLFGLEKCGDMESPIAKALPGLSGSPWRQPREKKSVCRYGLGQIAVVRQDLPSESAGTSPARPL